MVPCGGKVRLAYRHQFASLANAFAYPEKSALARSEVSASAQLENVFVLMGDVEVSRTSSVDSRDRHGPVEQCHAVLQLFALGLEGSDLLLALLEHEMSRSRQQPVRSGQRKAREEQQETQRAERESFSLTT
jgi:hypothetical protein